jgi:hypothetical protein
LPLFSVEKSLEIKESSFINKEIERANQYELDTSCERDRERDRENREREVRERERTRRVIQEDRDRRERENKDRVSFSVADRENVVNSSYGKNAQNILQNMNRDGNNLANKIENFIVVRPPRGEKSPDGLKNQNPF